MFMNTITRMKKKRNSGSGVDDPSSLVDTLAGGARHRDFPWDFQTRSATEQTEATAVGAPAQ